MFIELVNDIHVEGKLTTSFLDSSINKGMVFNPGIVDLSPSLTHFFPSGLLQTCAERPGTGRADIPK